MPDNRQQELLSAYLDAELSSDEQAEVEQLLAAQPEARQMLDDLRALSGTLQSLPRQRVGQDLSAQVLRRAERAMLANAVPADGAASEPEPAAPAATPSAAIGPATKAEPPALKVAATDVKTATRPRFEVSIGRSRRGWVWAAATLAAALLLVVYDRTRAPEPQLAQATKSSGKDVAFESRQERSETRLGDAVAANDPNSEELYESAADSDAADSLGRASDEVAQKHLSNLDQLAHSSKEESGKSGRRSGAAPAPGEKASVPGATATEPHRVAQNSRTLNREAMRRQAGDAAPARDLKLEVNDALPRGRGEGGKVVVGKGAVGNVAGGKGTAGKQTESKLAATARKAESAADTLAPTAEPLVAAPAIAAPAQQRMVIRAAPAQAALAIAGTEVRAEPTEMLVVHVHITAEALRDGAFEQVMATQNVRWEAELAASADANRAADKAANKKDAEVDLDADTRAGADRFITNGAVAEPAAKQAAVELFKRITERELQGAAPAAGGAPSEEAAPTSPAAAKPTAPSDAPLVEAPAKVQALKVKPQTAEAKGAVAKESEKLNESGGLTKSGARQSIRGALGKADVALAEGVVHGAIQTPGPQYGVFVEAPAAHVEQALAQLAADGRFVVQIESHAESALGGQAGQPLGGGGEGNSRSYFKSDAKDARAFGAVAPAESKLLPKEAPAPAADEAGEDQPAPTNAPARTAPKSDVKPEPAGAPIAGQRGAAQPGKLQMRSDASGKRTRDFSDERAKQLKAREESGPAESGARAWRIELPHRQGADDASESQIDGVDAKKAKSKLGRANAPLSDSEEGESLQPLERKPSSAAKRGPAAKGESAAAAPGVAKPGAPAALAESSNALKASDPAAPAAAEAAAQTATLGIAVPQNVRVLFVVRIAAPAEGAPAATPAPAAPPSPGEGESPK